MSAPRYALVVVVPGLGPNGAPYPLAVARFAHVIDAINALPFAMEAYDADAGADSARAADLRWYVRDDRRPCELCGVPVGELPPCFICARCGLGRSGGSTARL